MNIKEFSIINKIKIKQVFLLLIIIALSYLLLKELLFMLSAFLGSITLYIVMRKLHHYFKRKHNWKTWVATLFLIVCSIVVIVVPLYFIIQFIAKRIGHMAASPQPFIDGVNSINVFLKQRLDFTLLSPENIQTIKDFATKIISAIIGSSLLILTNVIIMYFILWYMLNNGFAMELWLKRNSLFNRKNTLIMMSEIKISVANNAIGIVILGFIQGLIAIVGYWIFGVKEPVLWGLITGAASVIPFVGTMIVWVPMAILLFAQGNIGDGIGLSIWGLILIGGIDNVLRFVLQKRLGETHPIITVLGVIIGINLFGFWGLIYGPVLITLFILMGKIYKQEYIKRIE